MAIITDLKIVERYSIPFDIHCTNTNFGSMYGYELHIVARQSNLPGYPDSRRYHVLSDRNTMNALGTEK